MEYSYITVLSNWLIGYDRYKKIYSKENISKSTYPKEFYLLKEDELNIGIYKAQNLLNKINIISNKIIRIKTVPNCNVRKNTKNNLGWVIEQNYIPVKAVQILENNLWKDITIEDLTAEAFLLKDDALIEYKELTPLTLSFLPVAFACQAKCKFCFSESSISTEQIKKISDFNDLSNWCSKAKEKGAKRFVITGGGEPTIIGFNELNNILKISNNFFDKNVLITNGLFLKSDTKNKIEELYENKLSVLSLSCHHHIKEVNSFIMGIDTEAHSLLEVISHINSKPTIRLVCVLQKGGVDSLYEIDRYINFALANDITQICFKELYVASTKESLYSKSKENEYCINNQINLDLILKYAEIYNLECINKLPWGSPIFRLKRYNKVIDIAAYTEPSVGWERSNGIARSWNYMADKKCYASLEDNNSIITLEK